MRLKIYTQEGCQYCKGVVEYLRKENIDFDEIKVSKEERMDIVAIPTICLDDKCIVGFNQERIKLLLKGEKNEGE